MGSSESNCIYVSGCKCSSACNLNVDGECVFFISDSESFLSGVHL
jgi:hypothetical protein